MKRRGLLVLAAAAFLGWMAYLGFAALAKSRAPVVSRAQAAAYRHAVVATVEADGDHPRKKVVVRESLSPGGPAAGTEIEVENLPAATPRGGYTGPGDYLLLLSEAPFVVVGQQRSPGNDLAGVGPPLVYRWSDDVRKQFEKLPRPGEP
jgi:hypothetical protein